MRGANFLFEFRDNFFKFSAFSAHDKMDSENEISTELSESLIDFVNNHSIEELYANLKDLDKVNLYIDYISFCLENRCSQGV